MPFLVLLLVRSVSVVVLARPLTCLVNRVRRCSHEMGTGAAFCEALGFEASELRPSLAPPFGRSNSQSFHKGCTQKKSSSASDHDKPPKTQTDTKITQEATSSMSGKSDIGQNHLAGYRNRVITKGIARTALTYGKILLTRNSSKSSGFS